MKKCFTMMALLLTYKVAVHAQTPSRAIVSQGITWLSFNSNVKLHKKFGLTFDSQNRFVGGLNNMQHMVRGGVEVFVTPKLTIAPLGYAYVWNYQYGAQPAAFVNNEHRIWQHITYKHTAKYLAIHHRLRFEERLIGQHSRDANDQIVDEGYSNHQFRIRYRLMANIPFNRARMDPKTAKLDPKTVYISLWDEVFISRGAAITYHQPDQNRLFAGLGYQINKDIAIQGGFFYQMLVKSNGAKQENNMGTLLQLNYNLNLTH